VDCDASACRSHGVQADPPPSAGCPTTAASPPAAIKRATAAPAAASLSSLAARLSLLRAEPLPSPPRRPPGLATSLPGPPTRLLVRGGGGGGDRPPLAVSGRAVVTGAPDPDRAGRVEEAADHGLQSLASRGEAAMPVVGDPADASASPATSESAPADAAADHVEEVEEAAATLSPVPAETARAGDRSGGGTRTPPSACALPKAKSPVPVPVAAVGETALAEPTTALAEGMLPLPLRLVRLVDTTPPPVIIAVADRE